MKVFKKISDATMRLVKRGYYIQPRYAEEGSICIAENNVKEIFVSTEGSHGYGSTFLLKATVVDGEVSGKLEASIKDPITPAHLFDLFLKIGEFIVVLDKHTGFAKKICEHKDDFGEKAKLTMRAMKLVQSLKDDSF